MNDDGLENQDVLSKGYGMVSKLVMQDRRLTVEAKAIYAYICSYAGSGNIAFPSIKKLTSDLLMSEKRLLKHRKLLEKYGYIKITRNRNSNTSTLSNNIYHIIFDLPYTEKPNTKNLPVQNLPVQNLPVQNLPVQNVGTNNNNINNNNINNNNINNNSNNINTTTTKYITNTKYSKSTNKENNSGSSGLNADEEDKEVYDLYLQEISRDKLGLSALTIDCLRRLIAEYSGEKVIEAIKISVYQNKRSLGYIEGVLKKQKKEGEVLARSKRDTKQEIDWSKFD